MAACVTAVWMAACVAAVWMAACVTAVWRTESHNKRATVGLNANNIVL